MAAVSSLDDLQVQGVTNRTLTLLENAGVELVPFESSILDIAANTSFFNGFFGALAFEEPDTLARQDFSIFWVLKLWL